MNILRFLRNFSRDESAQALPLIAMMLVMLLGMAGLTVDVGRLYYMYNELQSATDAAALAGAGTLPGSTASTVATTYSAVSGNKNAQTNMPASAWLRAIQAGVPHHPQESGHGLRCSRQRQCSPGQGAGYRSALFHGRPGLKTFTINATSTAAMRGASSTPYNVIIVVDTTVSMGDTDSDSNCANTRLYCALQGVQTLLQNLSPCGSSLTSCGTVTNGNVSKAVDKVSIYTFPGVTSGTLTNDYDCSGGVTATAYSYPPFPTTRFFPYPATIAPRIPPPRCPVART